MFYIINTIIVDSLLVGMSAALLWHFSNIWRYERYLIGEPNILIRSLETIGLLIILVFGLYKYIRDLKKATKKNVAAKETK